MGRCFGDDRDNEGEREGAYQWASSSDSHRTPFVVTLQSIPRN